MKFIHYGETLNVSDIEEIATNNSAAFPTALREALGSNVCEIELDLSKTAFLDCGGLGALVALRKSACRRNGNVAIRLLNPTPPVRHIFRLTGMDREFPIERR